MHLKEVPARVPGIESEVTQARDGPIVPDSPKESVEKVCMYEHHTSFLYTCVWIHTYEL